MISDFFLQIEFFFIGLFGWDPCILTNYWLPTRWVAVSLLGRIVCSVLEFLLDHEGHALTACTPNNGAQFLFFLVGAKELCVRFNHKLV